MCAAPVASGLVVLALNSGSSSHKFGLYRVGPKKAELLLTGEVEAKQVSKCSYVPDVRRFDESARRKISATAATAGGTTKHQTLRRV